MPVYHIVLFKLKPDVTQEILESWKKTAQAMVGQVPGLQRIDFGPPDAVSASRAKGFDMALVAILDKPETITIYAEHPAHQEVSEFRQKLCTDTLAYDLEFTS